MTVRNNSDQDASVSPRQPAVNAGPGVVEVVGPAAVEGVLEEVLEDVQLTVLHTPMRGLHHVLHMTNLGTPRDGLNDLHDGIENPGNLEQISRLAVDSSTWLYLCVLVYECESIGDVVIPEVNNTGPNPGSDLPLSPVNNLMHSSADGRSRLDSVQTLKQMSVSLTTSETEECGHQ